MTTATASKTERIAPERLAKIVRLVTALDAMRGRTVPAIREGGPHDGRAIVEQDADGFAVERTTP